ncbi:MAG: hypothetical protein Q7J28_18445 [Caulobacter sp.]|nr:hypothetical protein [Caulobacter sp.]
MIKFEPARTRTGRDVRRASVRHGWDHVLRCVSIAARLAGGDVLHGIILIAIIQANTAPLRLSNGDQDHDTLAGLPGDSQRTPVSAYAVAKQLGLPYETVRRHVSRLIDEGRCARVGARGGVIVPTAAIHQMRPDLLLNQSLESLESLISGLNSIGALQVQPFRESDKSMMIG